MTSVLIVGAGPAGIRAAQTLVAAGLRPMVVDEAAQAGGQIYRRPPAGFTRTAPQLYGSEAAKAQDLHRSFDALLAADAIDYRPRSSVVALRDGIAWIVGDGGTAEYPYDRLILATGASDRLVPVPGWQAPGVYTLGAAQIALKTQGVALGRRLILAGSGPLLTLVASQLRQAGAGVVAVLETSSLTQQVLGLRDLAARPDVLLRGLRLRLGLGRLYQAGVQLERIIADDQGVTALHWRDAQGRARQTACDTVALGWHLRAETQLADLAGVKFHYDPLWSQWLPDSDDWGRAGAGVYLAGDGVRLLGADGAEIGGRRAALACLQDLGLPAPGLGADARRFAQLTRFARGVARAFPWAAAQIAALPDDAILCRCEGITAGTLRATLPQSGREINRVKSLSRVGMGRCQGRYCQLAGVELIAQATGLPPADIGRLRSQPPVRPVPLSAYGVQNLATSPTAKPANRSG